MADRYDNLICNGFKINKGYVFQEQTDLFNKPIVSVFDNNAHFPLSLSRDHIQEDILPFELELKEHIIIEIINTILNTSFVQVGPFYLPQPNFLKLYGSIDLSQFLVVIGDEFTVLEASIFSVLKITDFIQLWIKNSNTEHYNFVPQSAYQVSLANKDTIAFYKQILENIYHIEDRHSQWLNLKSSSFRGDNFVRQFIPTSKLEYLLEGKRLSQSYKDAILHEKINDEWSQILSGKSESYPQDIDVNNISSDVYPIISKYYTKSKFDESNIFIKTWTKYLGEEWTFPIEISKRPELLKFKK
jgi:hypothetical protein